MRPGQLTTIMAAAALLVCASVAFAIDTEPLGIEQIFEPERPSAGGVEHARARFETLWIFDADFEDLTGDNAGWQSIDKSGTPFQENYWHHDTTRMQSFAWLEDSTWWCGTYNECGAQPRGYGNNWLQILSRSFPEVALNTNPGDPLTVDFDQRYAMEHDYDYGYVDVSTNGGGDWTTLHTVNNFGFSGTLGFPADWDDPNGHIQLDLGAYAGLTIDLRFRFTSDGALSSQDTPDNPPTSSMKDGAWQLDNITFTGPGGVFWADNCEDENMGWVHDDTQPGWQTGVTFERRQFGIDLFTGRGFTCEDRPEGSWMYAAVDDFTGKMVDYQWSWLMSPPINIEGATKLVGQWDMWIDFPNGANDLFDLELAANDQYECVTDPTGFIDEQGGVWFGGPFWATRTDNWDAWAGNAWLAILWEQWSSDAPDPGFEHMGGLFLNRQRVGIPVGDPGTTWETATWDRFNDWFHEDLAQALVDTPLVRAYDDQGIVSVELRASNDGGDTWNSYPCLHNTGTYWYRVPPPTDLMTRGSEILFYYEAVDGAANTSVYPTGAPDRFWEFSILPIVATTTDPGILLVDQYRRTVPDEDRSYAHMPQYAYKDALSRMGYEWDIYEVQNPAASINSLGPDTTGMKYYDTLIWFAAHNASYTLRAPDQYHLTEWLARAFEGKERNLLLTGNNMNSALQPAGLETLDFLNTWLGTEYIDGTVGEVTVDSLPRLYDFAGGYDFITDGGCILQGSCPVLGYFDVIGPAPGAAGAQTVAEYERLDMVRLPAGVAYDHPLIGYQSVNLGFAMERMVGDLQPNGHFIDGGPHRRSLLGNIMSYFGKSPTLPRTFLVRDDGTGDYPTIQDAINAAANGDTIELESGTFTGDGNRAINYLGKAVVVRSVSGDAQTCVIDCEGAARAFTFESGEDSLSVLSAVTVRNGYIESAGGGIQCREGSSPKIVDCRIEDCSAPLAGGLYIHVGSTPVVRRCILAGNTADYGGAIQFANVTTEIRDCTFYGNTATIAGSNLDVWESDVQLYGCILAEGTYGGSVIGRNGLYSCTLTCCDVYGNVGGDYIDCIAGQNGINGNFSADPIFCDPVEGDFHIHDSSPCADASGCGLVGTFGIGCGRVWHVPGDVPTIAEAMTAADVGDTVIVACGIYEEYDIPLESGVTLRSETGDPACVTIDGLSLGPVLVATDVDATALVLGITIFRGSGAGVTLDNSSPRFESCVIDSNASPAARGDGGGMYCSNGSAPDILDCVFQDNTASGRGGGLFCTNAAPTLTGCLFVGNDGLRGGAIWADPGSSLYLTNCTLTENVAGSEIAGGIGLDGTLTVDIANTIIANSVWGHAIYCELQETVTLSCCDIYNNHGGDFIGCIAGLEGVDGNFSEDPVFCGPENPLEPYALRSDSPCAAHNNPTCWWIGAYELGCISYVDWDAGGDGTDWSDPLNWDPNQVPGPGDHARIQLDGTYDVQFDDRAAIWALTHGASSGTQTLDIQGGTLTVTHGATNTSEIVVRDPGAIDADASMGASVITNEVGAVVTLENGDLVGSGSFENSGTVTKTGLGTSSLALSFLNEGNTRGGGLVQVDAGSLAIDGDFENVGRVAVNTGGTAIVSSHFLGRDLQRAIVTSSGEIDVDGSLEVNGELNNSGRVAVNTGGTAIVSSHFVGRDLLRGAASNSGVIEVDGDLDVAGDFENVGRVAVNTGGTAIVSSHFTDRGPRAGSFVNAPAGTISVDGSLEVDGGFENAGRVAVNTGGTAIVSSHFADTRLPQAGFDSSGSVSIAGGGSFTATGTGGVTSSGTFDASGTVLVEMGGSFANMGTAEVGIGGDFYADGSLSNAMGANFSNFGRTTIGGQGDITNSGFFHHRENAVLGGSGIFDTQNGLTTLKGIVSPGASYGTLLFFGDFVQTGASQLHLEVGGTTPGTEYDRLDISGNVVLGGAVSLVFDPAFVPVVGDSFDVLVHGGLLRGAGRDTTGFGCFSGLDISDTLHIEPVQHPDKFQFVAVEGTTGNASPLAVDDADSVVGYQPIMIPVLENDSDPDVDELRIIDILTDGTAGLAYVDVGDEGVTFAAAYGFEGDDFFDYVITDCMGGVDTARVTIGVTAPPRTLRVPDDYATIAGGIAAASAGDTVLIACGIYQESDISVPSGIILVSETGDPDCVVIDASGRLGRGLVFTGVDTTTVVRGITVTGGTAGDYGAGMFFSASSPRIEDCVLTGNSALYGAAVWCENAAAPTLTRCLITDNEAIVSGGAVGCEFAAAPTLVSCTLSGNTASSGSGIVAGGSSVVTLDRTIISFGLVGEAALCTTGATVTLTCSDVYGNAGGDYTECLAGQNGVDGNFSLDPQYCDAGASDYHLALDSPCADAPDCGVVGALPVGCIGETEIDVSSTSIEFVLLEGEMDCENLTVMNDGRSPLLWHIREQESGGVFARWSSPAQTGTATSGAGAARPDGGSEPQHRELLKGERDTRTGTPPERGTGGPDAFGYSWIDSDEPGGPSFDWQDITSVGTEVILADDDFEEVALPFAFPFYGIPHEWVRISSNGFLTFGPDAADYSNDPVPNAVDPDDLIALFWTDLDPEAGGTVHYHYDEPGDRFIVQYTGIDDYWSTGAKTFQAALHTDGTILFQYLDMQGDATLATVGIENVDASIGLEVAFNAAYVEDSLAVRIQDPAPFMTEEPPGGVIAGLGSEAVDLCVDVAGLGVGTYLYELVFESNDLNDPEVIVPVSVIVTTPPDIAVDSLAIHVTGDPGIIYHDPLMLSNDGGLDLTWRLGKREARGEGSGDSRSPRGRRELALPDQDAGAVSGRGLGGPDQYGYAWTDSDEPDGPTFSWRDITAVGTPVALGDDDFVAVALPFDFGFYDGTTFEDTVRISSDGYLTFGPGGHVGDNEPIPLQPGLDDFIAPFWDDLDPGAGGTIHYYHDASDTSFIVQYTNVPRAEGIGDYTFEVILRKEWTSLTGSILFQYLDMQGVLDSATIGIEDPTGRMGLEVVYDDAYVHDDLAVAIDELYGWLDAEPRSGVVAGGDSVTVDLVTDCTRAPSGEYAFQLIFYSDDPVDPELAVQYFLTVTGTGVADDGTLPRELALRGNFPNPFNPTTVIRYDLPADAQVSLRIYDVSGRLVRTLVDDVIQEGGYRSASWDGRDGEGRRVASGVYFYKLEANGKALRRKMILIK